MPVFMLQTPFILDYFFQEGIDFGFSIWAPDNMPKAPFRLENLRKARRIKIASIRSELLKKLIVSKVRLDRFKETFRYVLLTIDSHKFRPQSVPLCTAKNGDQYFVVESLKSDATNIETHIHDIIEQLDREPNGLKNIGEHGITGDFKFAITPSHDLNLAHYRFSKTHLQYFTSRGIDIAFSVWTKNLDDVD